MLNNTPRSLMHALCPQNTVVVERWWKVPLSKVGSPPRLHPRRHRIYKVVEDTKHAPREKMELILTQTVPSEWLQEGHRNLRRVHCCIYIWMIKWVYFSCGAELGGRGDTVFVKKSIGRNKLLPEGLAVYPSPENKQIFEEELKVCI